MSDVTFSIVIPARNGERFLREAISSAVRQTRRADEIIVVDDASTDNTADLAQSLEWREYVQYCYHKKGNGFVDAWNQAIQKATGDFVTILHQDDLLYPEYLALIEKASQRYPKVKHFYTACNYVDGAGKTIVIPTEPHSLEPVLYSGKQYAHNYLNGVIQNRHIHRCPGVTTSRELLLKECTYRDEAGQIADDDFFLRVGAFTDVVGISRPLAAYRQHELSVTGQLDLLTLKLARDYVFQVRFHKENETLLDRDDIKKVQLQAVKFINLLFFQSLLYKRADWTEKALTLRKELNELLPSFIEQNLPFWARWMWNMTDAFSGHYHVAHLYVQSVHGLIKARDFLKVFLAK